ncbi:MAG: hypothetical protein IIA66_04795 [Planctomycetes bacterium]|nr:hypothetical protein [Planctomycetota bacterium]
MNYRSHQISPGVESQTRGRQCGVIAMLILGAGALLAVSTFAPRSAEGFVFQEPPLVIDDGLTDEEREFIDRPISELTPEERKRRDEILNKMKEHLLEMMEKREQIKKEQGLDKKKGTKPPTTARPKRPVRRPTPPSKGGEPKGKKEEVKKEDAAKRPPIARPRKMYTPPGAEPPTEPEDNYRQPFDERQYSFGLRNGSYIELVEMFARKTGLPVLGLPVKLVGARPEDSLITYVSAELTDFRTTLHQINDLLFYEVLPPLYLYYNTDEFRLELDAFKELRFKLPPSRLFTSIEAVKLEVAQAKLMQSDIVRVFFRPESAADMRVFNEQVSNMFGEWVLMTTVEGTGVIDYTGRVDILEKIQDYMVIIGPMLTGEAELTILPVEYIEPSEALEKLMVLVDNVITGASEGNFRGRRTSRGRNVKNDPSTSEAQKILVIPDDDYDVLLVRGLPYKVAEVKKILEVIDRPPADPDFPDPVVIKLEHAQAESAAEILEEIVNGGRKPRIRTTSRSKKGETSRVVTSSGNDELRIIPYPRSNSLVLLGPQERIDHAKRIIADFLDKEFENKFLQVRVEHADPDQIAAKVLSLLAPPGKKGDRGPENLNIEVIGSVLFVRGEPAMMNTAASLIKELDGQMPKPTTFVVRLENAKPSEVVNYLRLIMAQSAAPSPKGKRAARQSSNVSRFVADDATSRVFFRGSQREWEHEILPLIELFDEAREEDGGSIEFVEIKYADPNNIVSMLNTVYGGPKRGKPGDQDGPQFIPTPRGVIITGTVSGSEIKHIRQMIDLMDPDLNEFEKRTFMLANIEPEEVKEAIISLFIAPTAGGGTRRPPKGGASAPAQTIRMALIPGGIIVHAPKEDMPELAEFIEQLDSDDSSVKFVRRNFDLEHADPLVVQEAIQNLFSTAGAPKGGKRRTEPGALDKNTIRTSISARSIIVFAAEDRFDEIERIIQTLDRPAAEDGIVTRRFEMIYADAEVVADQIEQMLEIKLAETQLRASGKAKARARQASLSVLANTNSIWVTAPLSIVEYAAELVPELDREEGEIEVIYKIYDCVNARADDLADLLNMLYSGGGIQTSRRSGDKKKDASARARDRIKRRLAGDGPENLNIVALPGNQALSISGPRNMVEQALVRAIEIDHKIIDDGLLTKTFTLLWADVDDVAEGIIEMLGEKTRGAARKASADLDLWDFETGPRRAGDISVWPRYQTSTLMVVAPADKMVLIEAFIEHCENIDNPDTDAPVLPEPFVLYRPKYLGAYEIVTMTRTVISTVYPNSLPVDLDYLNRNTVVLKGTRRYFDEVLNLITKYVDTEENAGAVEPVTSFLPPVPGSMHAEQVIRMVSRILTDIDVEAQNMSGMSGALLGDSIPEIPAGPE